MVIPMATIMVMVGHPVLATEAQDGYLPEDCIECHQAGSEESELQISIEEYNASVHGEEHTCLDCHTDVIDDDHQSTEGSGAVDCSECHEQENQHGMNGSDEERPACHDCHTRHNMLIKTDPASSVHPDQLTTTCAECHRTASGETDFFSWFPSFQIASHNKGDFATVYSKDNCIGCHQGAAAHGESEPISVQDCHKCHLSPGTDGAMWGYIHPQADLDTQPVVFAAASIYQIFVIIGVILLARKIFTRVSKRSSVKPR